VEDSEEGYSDETQDIDYYVYDNLDYRILSQTKRKIHFLLLSFFEARICRLESPHAFSDSFFIEKSVREAFFADG